MRMVGVAKRHDGVGLARSYYEKYPRRPAHCVHTKQSRRSWHHRSFSQLHQPKEETFPSGGPEREKGTERLAHFNRVPAGHSSP